MIKNKPYFYRDLERIRRETQKSPIYQTIIKEIEKNHNLGRFKGYKHLI